VGASIHDENGIPVEDAYFSQFVKPIANENDGEIDHIIFVNHDAKVFDIPFLVQKRCSNKMADQFFQDE
jgi:hypothetical protein